MGWSSVEMKDKKRNQKELIKCNMGEKQILT